MDLARIGVIVGLVLAFAGVAVAQTEPKGSEINLCLPPYRTILAEGGFSGIGNCSGGTLRANEAGEITFAEESYEIIDCRYTTASGPGGSAHGGQRILIFEGRKKYVGQYALGTPPFHRVWVQGNSVYIDVSASEGNKIKFDERGPPQNAYLAQAPASLFK